MVFNMEKIEKEKSDFIKAKIKEIRGKIVRPCTEFETKNLSMIMKIKLVG